MRSTLIALACLSAGCTFTEKVVLTSQTPRPAGKILQDRREIAVELIEPGVQTLGTYNLLLDSPPLIWISTTNYVVDQGHSRQVFLSALEDDLAAVGLEQPRPGREPRNRLRVNLSYVPFSSEFMLILVIPIWGDVSPMVSAEVRLETPRGTFARRFKSFDVASEDLPVEQQAAYTWRHCSVQIAEACASWIADEAGRPAPERTGALPDDPRWTSQRVAPAKEWVTVALPAEGTPPPAARPETTATTTPAPEQKEQPRPEARKCEYCGQKLEASARECKGCGYRR